MSVKEQMLSQISTFPTLPVMVTRLLKLLDEKDTAFGRIAEVIKYDPALTANVLKAANSAYLGFSRSVNSLTEASVRLGTKWIFKIAISSLIDSQLRKPAAGYDLTAEELWKHSMATALMAENLSIVLKVQDYWLVFTAALIHDMGKIIMGDFISDSFDEIQKRAEKNNLPFEVAEKDVIGIDHADVGALLAENWEFPQEIVECIRWHHNPDNAENITSSIDLVHVSDALCLMHGFGIGRDGLQYHPCEGSVARLNISAKDLELASSQMITSMEDIENMFKEDQTAEEPVGRW